jgi:uncharacterized membrane protein
LKQIGLFEMRRLEALSNTIFGVAMTLLAYDLPKASRFANAPAWIDLVNAYAQPVIALMISFIVAGVFCALLWILALRGHRNPELLATAIFPVFACVFATVTAMVAPSVAQFTWCLAFGAPLAGWLAARRWPLRTN